MGALGGDRIDLEPAGVPAQEAQAEEVDPLARAHLEAAPTLTRGRCQAVDEPETRATAQPGLPGEDGAEKRG